MLKFILKFILVVILIAACALAYGIYSYKSKLEESVQDIIIAGARNSNLNLAFEEFKINVIGAHAKALNIFIPNALLSLRIDEPRIEVPLLSAITLNPQVNFLGKFYDSEFNAGATYSISSKSASGRAKITTLDLSKVTQLSLLGIVKGVFNFQLENLIITSAAPEAFNAALSVEELRTSAERRFNAYINGNQEQIVIPPIGNLNLHAAAVLKDNKLSMPDAVLTSDLGSVNCNSELTFSRSMPDSISSTRLLFNLSPKGMNYFGYLLPKISNNILSSNSSKFSLYIEGAPRNLKYTFRP